MGEICSPPPRLARRIRLPSLTPATPGGLWLAIDSRAYCRLSAPHHRQSSQANSPARDTTRSLELRDPVFINTTPKQAGAQRPAQVV